MEGMDNTREREMAFRGERERKGHTSSSRGNTRTTSEEKKKKPQMVWKKGINHWAIKPQTGIRDYQKPEDYVGSESKPIT